MLRSHSIEDATDVLLCIPWADQSPPVAAGSSVVGRGTLSRPKTRLSSNNRK